MKRIALLLIVVACGQRDSAQQAAPAPAPAPNIVIDASAADAKPSALTMADALVTVGRGRQGDELPIYDPGPPPAPGSNGSAAPPRGRITVTEKHAFGDTTLTDDRVLVKVQQVYYAGMKRCYADGLKVDPTVRGKLVLKFTVLADGKTAKIVADGFDAAIDACLEGRAQAWRFAVPKDKNGEATEAAFELTFQLVPD